MAYAQFGYVPAPRSLFLGVSKVEPGTYVVFERDRAPVTRRFWRLEDGASRAGRDGWSLERATNELQEALRASVRSRLVADVPLGAFLSGGIDSSVIVALMAEPARQGADVHDRVRRSGVRREPARAAIAKHLGVANTAR